jgi:peptidoglycan/xylan/chitin deacetylase (PgdA/CDA1 family)
MTDDANERPGGGEQPRPVTARSGLRLPSFRHLPSPLTALVVAGALVLVGLAVAWVGAGGVAAAPPGVAWSLSTASNTVTVRLTPGSGRVSRRILDRSRLTVSENGNGHLRRHSADGGIVQIPVPPGARTSLLVRVSGPQPFQRTMTVTVPSALRVIASHRDQAGVLISASGPLRHRPHRPLCGTDGVSFPASSEVAIAQSAVHCRARLRLTAPDGERAVVTVNVPGMPKIPLYAFARSAHRAIYITVDDGWTPSPEVLTIMRRTHLPVTAFLIQHAAEENLPYWRAFVQAGGTVGDHTVSHPNLTKLTLNQATAQWGQARRGLGRLLGQTPVMGRPPYGAFNPAVEAAAYRGGLKALVGWSATADSDGIHTWNGKALEPGEIVLLHWIPGLGHQMVMLLKAIHARHLNPEPLTRADFAGITPQTRSLSGD